MSTNEFLTVKGTICQFPKAQYRPEDLTDAQQWHLRERLVASARFDGLDDDAAEEAGSAMWLHWRTRDYSRCDIARGEHARAYYAVRRYARLSNWKGFTGMRRDRKAKVTAEAIAMRERLRERNNPTPDEVAIACERIAGTVVHSRKAYRLAKRIGLPGVRELVREACGFCPE